MKRFSLGKPLVIDGQEVIVVRDIIGSRLAEKASDTYSLLEPRSPDGRPPIFVSENDLARLRDDFPGVKVYGLWQILFHNKAVKLGAPLVTYKFTDRAGLYLMLDIAGDQNSPANIVSSGEYLNNMIPDNYDADLEMANVIDVDIANLKLPNNPAYTRLEQTEKQKAETKRRWMVVGSLCGLIAIGAVAANYGLQTIYKSKLADYTTKRALIDELGVRVKELSSERLLVRPDDSEVMSRLFKFFEAYPDAATFVSPEDVKVSFVSQHILITQPDTPIDPAKIIEGAASELLPDLGYKVVISDSGDQGVDSGASQ